jgi:molecular chaperone GrpE
MSVPERGIEQEVVPPAGAPSPPSDWGETARGEAARAEARAEADAAAARAEDGAAQAGSEADAAEARPEDADAAARPEDEAAQAGSEADAAQARPENDAAQAGSEADAADARHEDGAAQAGSEADAAEAGPEAADAEAATDAEGEQAPDEDPAGEAYADLHERAGKADAYLQLAQRTQADFDNYRKRMTRDVRAAEARGISRLARELLPAIDNLERALAAVDAAEPRHHLSEGIRLVTAELSAALGRTGIQGYDPKGERFDPVQHEAVAQQPVAGAEPGTVVEVLQAGYRLNEAILRPARVIVAS